MKIKFKNSILFKVDANREKLEHALKIPTDTEFDRLNGSQFLSVVSLSNNKEKSQNGRIVCTIRKFEKNLAIILNIVQIIQDCVLHHLSYFILVLIMGK